MNESFEIFEKSHLGGSGGALKVGEELKKQGFPCIFLPFYIVIYKGKIIAPTSRASPGPPDEIFQKFKKIRS